MIILKQIVWKLKNGIKILVVPAVLTLLIKHAKYSFDP